MCEHIIKLRFILFPLKSFFDRLVSPRCHAVLGLFVFIKRDMKEGALWDGGISPCIGGGYGVYPRPLLPLGGIHDVSRMRSLQITTPRTPMGPTHGHLSFFALDFSFWSEKKPKTLPLFWVPFSLEGT